MVGRKCNLTNPHTFTEKLQWLKLFYRDPIMTILVDKVKVKDWVKKTIGEEFVIPTLYESKSYDNINWETLPQKFVVKCNHDSGSVIVCTSKSTFNPQLHKNKINKALRRNYYWEGREWAYKDVDRTILVEQYLEHPDEDFLIDYKFHCFNGEPRFLYISQDSAEHVNFKRSHLNIDWTPSFVKRGGDHEFEIIPPQPKNYQKMIDICRTLSKGLPFVRVDLYNIGGQIYFSEMTLYPASGFCYYDYDIDLRLGEMLEIS